MIKKLAAGVLELVHLAAMAILLTASAWVAPIPAPLRTWKGSGLTTSYAQNIAEGLEQYLLDRGPWIAAIGLFALAVAGFLRGDSKKMMPLVRLVAVGSALLFAMWATMDLKPQRIPTAWNCLFVATAIDALCTAFLVTPGKGGGKSAAPSGKDA